MVAAVSALALTALIAACNLGGSTTPRPSATSAPTTPPTVAPSPTATPTATPTAVPSPTFGADQIEHPTGATDIVLRMEAGGGFVPMGAVFTQAPTFTLYGDGTVIFQPVDKRNLMFGEAAFLPWRVAHLDEEAVQALLNFALTTGRLANAKESYEGGLTTDAATTYFTLNAAGMQKSVSVYDLSELTEPGPEAADRAGFSQLAEVLRTFENQDELGEVTTYDPELYRVVLFEAFGDPAREPMDWPWDDLTVDDFSAGDEPGRIANLDREHVADLLEVPNGGHGGIWALDPDGNPVQFGVRPLLPDEIAAIEEVSG